MPFCGAPALAPAAVEAAAAAALALAARCALPREWGSLWRPLAPALAGACICAFCWTMGARTAAAPCRAGPVGRACCCPPTQEAQGCAVLEYRKLTSRLESGYQGSLRSTVTACVGISGGMHACERPCIRGPKAKAACEASARRCRHAEVWPPARTRQAAAS